jgi:hypothetical protein
LVLAAALGKVDLLTALSERLGWWTADTDALGAGAQRNQPAVIEFFRRLNTGDILYTKGKDFPQGIARCGGEALPLLQAWPGDKELFREFLPLLVKRGNDPLPVLDYLASHGVRMEQHEETLAFAKLGALDRVRTASERNEGRLPPGVIEAALSREHGDIAEFALTTGATWSGDSGAGKICKGYGGDTSVLTHWITHRGCPADAASIASLCRSAAKRGFIHVLSFAETLPAFPSWQVMSGRLLAAAARYRQEEVARFLLSRVSVQAMPPEDDVEDEDALPMVEAVQSGNLAMVKLYHEAGFSLDHRWYEAAFEGPSHHPVLRYIFEKNKVMGEGAWYDIATHWDDTAEETVTIALDEYSGHTIPLGFVQGAATHKKIKALQFAFDRGVKDTLMCARLAFRRDHFEVFAWLQQVDPVGLAAVPIGEVPGFPGGVWAWLWHNAVVRHPAVLAAEEAERAAAVGGQGGEGEAEAEGEG